MYARKRAEHRAEAVTEVMNMIEEVESDDLEELARELRQMDNIGGGWDSSEESEDDMLPELFDGADEEHTIMSGSEDEDEDEDYFFDYEDIIGDT